MKNIAVIGAGMSGLCFGILAHDSNINIDIYERQEKPGKKLLLTGNGKCNLFNNVMNESCYYSKNMDFIHNFFDVYRHEELFSFYKQLGLLIKDKNDYVYPLSNQASTVADMLIDYNNENNNLICNTYVDSFEFKNNKYIINNKSYDYVIFSSGGMAGIYRENEFNVYKLLKNKDINVERAYPALTRIISDETYPKELQGIRLDAVASLFYKDKLISSDEGEIQFTDKGLSGIPIFQLSLFLGSILNDVYINKTKNPYIELDLIPNMSEDDLFSFINYQTKNHKDNNISYLNGLTNKKLIEYLLKTLNINSINETEIKMLVNSLKHFKVSVLKTDTFKNAQVSTGGVSLLEINDKFESNKYKNLFMIGEMLDFTGKCGGYNLAFALYSALIAAKEIKKRC